MSRRGSSLKTRIVATSGRHRCAEIARRSRPDRVQIASRSCGDRAEIASRSRRDRAEIALRSHSSSPSAQSRRLSTWQVQYPSALGNDDAPIILETPKTSYYPGSELAMFEMQGVRWAMNKTQARSLIRLTTSTCGEEIIHNTTTTTNNNKLKRHRRAPHSPHHQHTQRRRRVEHVRALAIRAGGAWSQREHGA